MWPWKIFFQGPLSPNTSLWPFIGTRIGTPSTQRSTHKTEGQEQGGKMGLSLGISAIWPPCKVTVLSPELVRTGHSSGVSFYPSFHRNTNFNTFKSYQYFKTAYWCRHVLLAIISRLDSSFGASYRSRLFSSVQTVSLYTGVYM